MSMIDRNDLRHTQKKPYKETTKIYAGQIQSQLPAYNIMFLYTVKRPVKTNHITKMLTKNPQNCSIPS